MEAGPYADAADLLAASLNKETAPRFSVVIPAYNEERLLPRLLDSIDAASKAYGGGSRAIEVVVADNASTDRTAAAAVGRGCRVVRVERRIIAAARNDGARASRGEVLCFVDADSRIHPKTFTAIDAAYATGSVLGGATGVAPERWSLGFAVTYALIVPFVWLTGIDTGVVFCRRDDFETVGGYDERRRLAEDVAFALALRRLASRRGQRLTRLRTVKTIASLRKFDEHGEWHYLTFPFHVAREVLVRRRRFQDTLDEYWYRPNR